MKSIAIVGTGIAGLACAYQLRGKYKLTLFEQNNYIGGHSNTVDITENRKNIPVDTGFMVFNTETYPNLTKLFYELSVPNSPTDMSFSMQVKNRKNKDDLEWCGSSLNQLFAQRKNILNPKFLRMILDLSRFNENVEQDANSSDIEDMTITEYVKKKKLSDELLNFYLIPMSSAIWSSPPKAMNLFPAQTLLRFFHNHRLNRGLKGHLQWLTIKGGAKEYISRITNSFSDSIKLNTAVSHLKQTETKSQLRTTDGQFFDFDFIIVATHADQALALLEEPTYIENSLLSKFKYTSNSILLHTDQNVMPKLARCWASWNYRADTDDAGKNDYSTHYWMNNLQALSTHTNYFVSVNGNHLVKPDRILKSLVYEHPTFNIESIKVQSNIQQINRQNNQRIFFCGSYFKYGFHEDGLNSALELCSLLNANENL